MARTDKTQPQVTTVTPAAASVASNALNGKSGFTAMGFAKSTLKAQLDFLLGVAIMRAANPVNDVPAFDAAIVEAMGDQGLPTQVKLNLEELSNASAAAFVLVARHVKTPHPESGRKEEFLTRFLKSPKEIVTAAVDYQAGRSIAQANSTAAMLKGDASKRVAAIKEEATKRVEATYGQYQAGWVKSLGACTKLEDSVLIESCMEALVNADRDPSKEIARAAKAFLEAQRKRMEDGKFVAIDAGVYALAQ